ncbi:protein NO VEIN domain-containing protein [Nostoc sp.]|uniref:protein NO VEIN domain-containing protein n=1 Tax=Nostoc sp. TaxID=1180 RepID=UPI002FF9556C
MATFIFLCNDDIEIGIRHHLEDAKKQITAGNFWKAPWNSGNSNKIKIGDRAYLKRTGSKPHGFFAAGKVLAAPQDKQQRVILHIDSVVDFDQPLDQQKLKYMPQFKGANFTFMQGGCEFDASFCEDLDSAWEEHSMVLSRKGYGKRLVDTFYDRGQTYKDKMSYQAAIDAYNQALLIQPRYSKAVNALTTCESLLKKQNAKKISEIEEIKPDNTSKESESSNISDSSNESEPIQATSIVQLQKEEEQKEETTSLGAGFGNYQKNKEVEKAAIDFVQKQYDGWDIQSFERDKVGYDLTCTKDSIVKNVEVKGVSGGEPAFIITANEIEQANKNPNFVLWVVTSALNSPKGYCWTGCEMLSQFELKPIQYMARLRPIFRVEKERGCYV